MRPYICRRGWLIAISLAAFAAPAVTSNPAAVAAVGPAAVISAALPVESAPGGGVMLPSALQAARRRVRLKIRRVTLNVLEGTRVVVAGTLLPALPGRVLTLRVHGPRGWRVLASAVTGRRGRFVLRYTPHRTTDRSLQVRFSGDAADFPAHRMIGRLGVYRLAAASWYGGGGGLACGGYLTSSTMGVANKTLPCGTMVTLRYGGRSVHVPVVDRGPYVAGREFDLTEATKRALGFEGVGEVWSSR
jgi:hypothetical protein